MEHLYSISLTVFIAFSLSLFIFSFFRSSRHPHPHLALPPVPPPPSDLSTTYPETYDVFLSFRGEDTRNNFTSYLYEALCRKEIRAFIDDQELDRGAEISMSLWEAIEQSKVSVIIFSKNYASSKWCLDELVKILDCMKKNKQIVIPVFYKIDPSNVRNQRGSYSLFPKHWRLIFQCNMYKLSKWKAALTETAGLSGCHSINFMSEAKLMDELVEDILLKLNRLSLSEFNFEDLEGIERHIENVESLLQIGSSEVRIVGVWGMGGIGKTTIAKAVFTKLSSKFKSCCFVPNVRERVEYFGLDDVRDKYLSRLLGKGNLYNGTPGIISEFVKKRLSRKNALVVFDDVNKSTQLEYFLGSSRDGYLGSGSRIMITSRDRQVLAKAAADEIYMVPKMHFQNSLPLFSLHAFKENNPLENFMELSESIVNYCDGNPLALKVLGSSLNKKSKEEWESALKNLKEALHVDIQDVLKLSYSGLDHRQQAVFLDIACFFDNHEDKSNIINMLGESAVMILTILTDLALISTSSLDSKVEVHALLRQMGQEIVFRESPSSGKHSRLWRPKEIYHVLRNNTGTDAVECIFLDMSKIKALHVTTSAFAEMSSLRILKFYDSRKCRAPYSSNVRISEDLKSAFNELRYFEWVGYPRKSLPLDSTLETLAELILPYSQVEHTWKVQCLPNLRAVDLSCSAQLKRFPDVNEAPNLKYVNLSGCCKLSKFPATSTNIVELDLTSTAIKEVPLSVASLAKLSRLNLSNCKLLTKLPNKICKLKSLCQLVLTGCRKLKKFPQIEEPMINLWLLCIDTTSIKELPSSLEHLIGLRELNLNDCKNLQVISDSICSLNSLKKLFISHCPRIMSLPVDIKHLTNLAQLDLSDSKRLRSLPELPPSLDYLDVSGCSALETVSHSREINPEKRLVNDRTADVRMDYTNCLNLNHDACDNIRANTMRGLHYCLDKMLSFEVIFPGSEVPEGFPYESEGSSLTIPMIPSIWGNAESWGFVACVVFEVKCKTPVYAFKHMCEIKCENEGENSIWSFPLFRASFSGDRFFEKDHVIVSCHWDRNGDSFPRYNSDGYHNVTFTILCNPYESPWESDPCTNYNDTFKVKKVGIYAPKILTGNEDEDN